MGGPRGARRGVSLPRGGTGPYAPSAGGAPPGPPRGGPGAIPPHGRAAGRPEGAQGVSVGVSLEFPGLVGVAAKTATPPGLYTAEVVPMRPEGSLRTPGRIGLNREDQHSEGGGGAPAPVRGRVWGRPRRVVFRGRQGPSWGASRAIGRSGGGLVCVAPHPPPSFDPRGVPGVGRGPLAGPPKKGPPGTPLRCKAQGGWGGSAH